MPQPNNSANPHPQRPLWTRLSWPLGLGLTLGLTALAGWLGSQELSGEPQDEPQGEPQGEPEVVIDEATQRTLDSLFAPPTERELAAAAALPDVQADLLEFQTASGSLPTSGTWREHPTLADFDGDGFLDLVATNREEDGINIWRNDGAGGWELSIEGALLVTRTDEHGKPQEIVEDLPRNLMYGGTAAADLDEDGDLDLVFGAHQDPGLHIFFNQGGLRWRMKPHEEIESDSLLLDVTTGDVNGDGHIDVAGIGQFEGGAVVHLGDGKGGLTRINGRPELIQLRRGTQVELADLDADGNDDLIAVSDRGLRVLYSRVAEDGSVTFEDQSKGLPRPAIGNSLRGVAIADFDEDGDLDIASGCIADPSISTDQWNYLGLYRRTVDGRWEQFDSGLERRMAQHDVLAADVDLDGHMDLLCITTASRGMIWLGDGKGGFEVLGQIKLPGPSSRSAIGDIDRDGRIDVVYSAGPSKQAPNRSGIAVHLNRAEAVEAALAKRAGGDAPQ